MLLLLPDTNATAAIEEGESQEEIVEEGESQEEIVEEAIGGAEVAE